MHRDEVIAKLAAHEAEWRAFGVKSLSVFGSLVRGEAGPDSDIDLLIEFDGRASFDRYMELKFRLEELLGVPVDLVIPRTLKPRLRDIVEREAIRVA